MNVMTSIHGRGQTDETAVLRTRAPLLHILLFFIIAPVACAAMQTSLQIPVMANADFWLALGFALMFNVPGMFTAWATTCVLARLPGMQRLPIVPLLMLGFMLSLLIFRPYNRFVFETISEMAPQISHFSGASGNKSFWEQAERFLLVNVPGVLIWTVLNLLFIEKLGFPSYRPKPEVAPATALETADDGTQNPGVCDAAGIGALGDLWAISAEEHYLRLHTRFGTRHIRHSFRAALAQMPPDAGLQVHRSHWVAYGRVADVEAGKSVRLRLRDGTLIPVSSSYRQAVLLTKAALTAR